MKHILQSYLRRLTNLTGKNRSLLLLRLISDQFIDIHDFDFLDKKPSFDTIKELIGKKAKTKLCQLADSRDERNNIVSRKLKRLFRIDKYIFEERGSKDLYVGWPFIRGRLSDGTLVRCPLIFFPVELVLQENTWYLTLREDVNITFNKSFILAYAYFNQIKIEEDFLEQVFDDFDRDSTVFRTNLYQLIKNSPVELNFNQENFLDELCAFKNYKKADLEKEYGNGELKMFPEAVLGIFPQAGSYLVPDYHQLIDTDQYEDIETFFAHRSRQEDRDEGVRDYGFFYFLNKVKEEETFTPYKLDAYQENALKAIKRGNSMVIQGPPGTGKSQLICNLISDFIARGKRVLLVCQKRAALDVVHERLKSNDISDFVGLVHDFKNDRKKIYEQINDQVERLHEYRAKNNGLDAIQIERNFLQSSRKIDQITEEFEEFKEALFDEGECGLSVKELYLTCDQQKPVINMKQEYKYYHFEDLQNYIDKLRIYFAYNTKYGYDNYSWKNRKRFSGYGISDLQNMKAILEEIPKYQESLSLKIKELTGSEMDLESAQKIEAGKDQLLEMLNLLQDEQSYKYFIHIIESRDVMSDSFPDVLWLSTLKSTLLGCFEDPGPETSIKTEELGKILDVLKRKRSSQKNILSYLKWLLFSREKQIVRGVLNANKLTGKRKDIRILEKKLDYRLNLEHNITKIKNTKWLSDFPSKYKKKDYENWFDAQINAVSTYLIFDSFRNFKEYFNFIHLDLEGFTGKIRDFIETVSEIPAKRGVWTKYLRDARIDIILSEPQLAQEMTKTLKNDFDALCDFDNLKEELKDHEREIIDRLLSFEGVKNEDDMVELFQNSLRLSWIDHIETKFPILRSVNSLKFDHLQKDLQESVKQKLKISNDITLLKAREQTYQDVEYNRLNNMVTYRDLIHQVTKKRQIWPIRKLIGNYKEEVFNLLPCWMASPEAVSAIFPMEQMFDLVIFDEASQCFVERGIPAMYRGKQIVVTGDDKQLSPFDLYKVRWEDETEDEDAALEVDSLLNLANQYLMTAQLRGHYRSQSLDLIDFSNQHFYNGNLKLLPDKLILDKQEPAIKYIKADGVWEDQHNPVEAEKVVDLVEELLQSSPGKEIGVVTFNARQQDHIMDILDERVIEKKLVLPETFFVKNIENVQGDEKDIIIFSVGYAPDEKGKMNLQFGSLNIQKGENRLNVAVTRARENVFVVSSIWPQQLSVEHVKNDGPKLLKKYLQYALDVSEKKFVPTINTKKGHHIDWYLKYKLQQLMKEDKGGFVLKEEMPFADLTVKSNDDYLGLIITDDDLYYQGISIKDIHIYTPFTLSAKHWKFLGVYSREYWHDKEVIRERLLRFTPEE